MNRRVTVRDGSQFAEQVQQVLQEARVRIAVAMEEVLDEASLSMMNSLRDASPIGDDTEGLHFRDQWDRKMQYKGVRYIGNKKRVPWAGKTGPDGVPLSIILEYGNRSRPFIKSTFESRIPEINQIIIQKLGGKM